MLPSESVFATSIVKTLPTLCLVRGVKKTALRESYVHEVLNEIYF
jgi:hypothetical protein